jgi:hypothetical protein
VAIFYIYWSLTFITGGLGFWGRRLDQLDATQVYPEPEENPEEKLKYN